MKKIRYSKFNILAICIIIIIFGVVVYLFLNSNNNIQHSLNVDPNKKNDLSANEMNPSLGKDDIPSDKENNEEEQNSELANSNNNYQNYVPAFPETNNSQNDSENSKEISIPYKVPGTELVIKSIRSYSGDFIEDGTDRTVDNISAILLENSSDSVCDYFEIQVNYKDTNQVFSGSSIPPRETVVVLEKNAQKFIEEYIDSISGLEIESNKLEMSEGSVEVIDSDDGEIMIKNLTDKTIPSVRVFYKYYDDKNKSYLGGITYTLVAENLTPGESRTLKSNHYSKDISRVLMVKTYNGE